MDQADVLRKVKALLDLSKDRAASVQEAAMAAAMAQRLIQKYRLDGVLLSSMGDKPEDETVTEDAIYTFDGPRAVTWVLHLSGSLGASNCLKVWYYKDIGVRPAGIMAAGRPDDIATTRYMMAYLIGEIDRLTAKAIAAEKASGSGPVGKSWGNSFRLGAVAEISARIEAEMARARDEARNPELAYQRAMETGDQARIMELDAAPKHSLMRVDAALAKIDARLTRASDFVARRHRLTTGAPRTGARSSDAYGKGIVAGRSVGLSSPNHRLGG